MVKSRTNAPSEYNTSMPMFIGVGGGTGAGKSSLCTALMDMYPDKIGLIQLDDYFKPSLQVPKFHGHSNWDHPDSLFLDKLASDLNELSKGNSVVINTKNERLNPGYKQTGKRIPAEFKPKQVMLVEGYLVLYDERIRSLLSTSFWLEVDHATRWARRVHFKNDIYEEQVAIPMHRQFAEPTKQFAVHVIDVTNLSKEQVFEKVEKIIQAFLVFGAQG